MKWVVPDWNENKRGAGVTLRAPSIGLQRRCCCHSYRLTYQTESCSDEQPPVDRLSQASLPGQVYDSIIKEM